MFSSIMARPLSAEASLIKADSNDWDKSEKSPMRMTRLI